MTHRTKAIIKKTEPAKPTEPFKLKAEEFIANLAKVKVANVKDYERGIELLMRMRIEHEAGLTERDRILEPAKTVVKVQTALWKPVDDTFNKLEETLTEILKTWHGAAEEDLATAYKKLQEAGKKLSAVALATKEQELAALLPPKTVYNDLGSATMKDLDSFEIVDPEAIPREYWKIDEVKLRAAVVTQKLTVPGVVAKSKKSLALSIVPQPA